MFDSGDKLAEQPGKLVRVANGPWRMVFQRRYAASPERVWRAITNPTGGFWGPGRLRIDPRVGGELAIDFGDCDGGSGWAVAQITAYEPQRFFAYRALPGAPQTSWALQPVRAQPAGLRPVGMSPAGDQTLLTFRPAEQPLLVIATGWHATLDNLARALAGQPLLSDAEFAALEAQVAPHYRSLPGIS